MIKLNCIMLIDDNSDDNFFHERVIQKKDFANTIIVKQSASEALQFLNENKSNAQALPNLIFLDINMPGMNGWEFLEEYAKFVGDSFCPIIIMLTTSDNPDDKAKAKSYKIVSDFKTKPLTKDMLSEIASRFFESDSK